SDGTIWGGEFLVADYKSFSRVGHLEYVPMPGGAAAIERPYRMAFSYILTLLGESALNEGLPFLKDIDHYEKEIMKRQIEKGINCPLTSSCGRLFDGVSALLGIRWRVDYEAQAAVELEMAAPDEIDEAEAYPFSIVEQDGVKIVKLKELFEAIIYDIGRLPVGIISLRFHHTVARMIAEMCRLIARDNALCKVALSGGVFQNRLLLRLTVAALEKEGFEVLTHSLVPTNDGGISLGQAVISFFRTSTGGK
ncbi:MAG: carbamoyltransferase HypF, partial [Dehalococcoidia bacterium]|nr:carbamoyltransferase HypF [Dehalococcoidia bacterium]